MYIFSFSEDENQRHVEKLMGCVKPWLYQLLYTNLSKQRTPDDRTQLVDKYFVNLETCISQKSSHSPVVYKVADIVISKL